MDIDYRMLITKIAIYEPACLIVGTRGKSLNGIQGLLPGSVSKYCLQNSPVPVIVVRPSSKREKKKRKRRADPSRRSYFDILEKSGGKGSQVLDKIEQEKQLGYSTVEASEKEALEVARAIGIPTEYSASTILRKSSMDSRDGHALTKVTSVRSDYTSGPESPSPTGGMSPDPNFLDAQSPDLDDADSSSTSEDEDGSASKTEPSAETEVKVEEQDAPKDLKIGSDII